ncbi:protein ABHD4 [Anoplophora glabripennis]|uniref:protein ABHD4 n=1 Tax=Anoplophora glabripennis TaxID=217634 RepID=UPI0008742CB5|nr:protein ABHD4 [Anoplophora glabripennis]
MENTTQYNEKCGWTKFSEAKLVEMEKKILQVVKTAYKTWFVPIGPTVGTDDKIWTILLNEESKNTPIVLLHGFAAALGFWCLNFDSLAKERPVYAIDLLGFGRSTRPTFSTDGTEAEQQMVQSLEAWRKQLDIENFILLGHSFGGYLATSYAINYPDRVKHLILADPWGFAEQPAKFEAPLWIKTLRVLLYPLSHLNPLATVRAAGPIGPWLVRKVRNDISEKYASVLENKDIMAEYIYQCNSRNPSGETAFHYMRKSFVWAKNPMVHRFDNIREDIPITVMFGENSWITQAPGHILKEQRPKSYVDIAVIANAGHHISADQPSLFHEVVLGACGMCDSTSNSEVTNDQEIISNNEIIETDIDEEGAVHQIKLIRNEEYQLHQSI